MLLILKYLFSVVLTLAASMQVRNSMYFVAGILELCIIFVLTNFAMKKKRIGQVLNDVLLLLYNAQMAVLLFANSYITMVMLTNIVSIKALSGKAIIYIVSVILVFVFSFLPVKRIDLKKEIVISCALFILEGIFLGCLGAQYSVTVGYCTLVQQQYRSSQIEKEIENARKNDSLDSGVLGEQTIIEKMEESEFYKESVIDCRIKDEKLGETPNVILIFTEGLSQNIIDDERGIMPNVKEWQSKSLQFINYYNHTFATYRGLISQLYSGYQKDDFDNNVLVSLQSVLKDQGYDTLFINSEPNNADFTAYLNDFGFDVILGDTDSECKGMADSISDKDVYEMLFDAALEHQASGTPFFISTYTFGTHASLDSTDEVFGDGKDAELNKFYNVDYWFGEFMEKIINSSLADDTIIVFTADHATYQDNSFSQAFPEYYRETTSMDRIPFFIYYEGIEAEEIDVEGRNSICLTPTILDYLDISVPNFFVGTSLFSEQAGSICETSYSDSHVIYTSKDGVIGKLEDEALAYFDTIVKDYYIFKVLCE